MSTGVPVEGAQQPPHPGPSLEQLRFGRPGRDPEDLPDLLVCVSLDIVEDHDLPHPLGKPVQRPFQLLLEENVPPRRGHGNLLRHGGLSLALRLGLSGSLKRRIHRDAVKPGRESGVSPECREGPDGPDPRLLRVILRQLVVTGDPPDDGVDPRGISLIEDPDRSVVSLACLPDQLRFTQFSPLPGRESGPRRGPTLLIV